MARREGCILTVREMEGAGRHNISGRPDPDGSGSWADHGVAPPTMRARPKMVELPRGGVSRWGIRSAVDHLCRNSTRAEEGLTGKPRDAFLLGDLSMG